MSSITVQQRNKIRDGLRGIGLADDDVASVRDSVLDKLAAAGYDRRGRLKTATLEDLKGVGLETADARFIVSNRDGEGRGGGKAATGGQGLLAVAVGGPLLLLALVVDHGVGKFDEAVQYMKAFITRNDPHLAVTYKNIRGHGVVGSVGVGVRGLGFVGSVGVGVALVVGACLKRLNVRPGRPRVLHPVNPKLGSTGSEQGPEQHSNLAPASPAMSDSLEVLAQAPATGQVDAPQDQ